MTSADKKFAARSATRLKAALADRGAPMDGLNRDRYLAELMAVPPTEASHLLSGLVPWSWAQLDRVATVLHQSPAYFLDERDAAIPPDTVVVPAVDGGESIVWRTPTGFLKRPVTAHATLRYLTLHAQAAQMPAGTLVVFEQVNSHGEPLVPGDIYVIECDGRLEAGACIEVNGQTAAFTGGSEVAGRVVDYPPKADAVPGAAQVVGAVVAAISPRR